MDKIKSAVFGAILGDAMGVPYEFPHKLIEIQDGILGDYKIRVGGRYYPTELVRNGGSFSDDSQMLLMTLRSLQYSDFTSAMIAELKAFMTYECGAGRATRVSCDCWEKGNMPWACIEGYYDFGGNGVCMRVLPHAFCNESIEKIMDMVMLNGILTHGSPVALVSAKLYVYYAWCKYNNIKFDIIESQSIWGNLFGDTFIDNFLGKSWLTCLPDDYEDEWSRTITKMLSYYNTTPRNLNEIMAIVPVCGSEKGAGHWCTVASILLDECIVSDRFEIMQSVACWSDVDTDTLCSMVGGLFGIDNNIASPYIVKIEDSDYIASEVESFKTSYGTLLGNFCVPKNLKTKLKNLSDGCSLTSFPFGKITLADTINLHSLSDTFTSRLYVYSTQLGQTLTILSYKKS